MPVSRIKLIKEIKYNKTVPNNINKIKVLYELNMQPEYFKKNDNENIIKSENDKLLIEAETSNPFFLKQRLLQFGPICKILEPAEFKNEFIQQLKDMKAGYYGG